MNTVARHGIDNIPDDEPWEHMSSDVNTTGSGLTTAFVLNFNRGVPLHLRLGSEFWIPLLLEGVVSMRRNSGWLCPITQILRWKASPPSKFLLINDLLDMRSYGLYSTSDIRTIIDGIYYQARFPTLTIANHIDFRHFPL